MTNKINIAQITTIEVYVKRKSSYTFQPAYKSWIKTWSYPEVWTSIFEDKMTREDLSKSTKYTLGENNIIYYKPYIKIRMSDGTSTIKYFEYETYLKEYIAERLSDIKFLDIYQKD